MKKQNIMMLDQSDLVILETLLEDSRSSFCDIGKKLGMTDSGVHLRYKKLKENGYIVKATLELSDRAKLEIEYLKNYVFEEEATKEDESFSEEAERFGFKKAD